MTTGVFVGLAFYYSGTCTALHSGENNHITFSAPIQVAVTTFAIMASGGVFVVWLLNFECVFLYLLN